MSYHEYQESLDLGIQDVQFYALIMAAMRKADSTNVLRLQGAFPEVWDEFKRRYNAPSGKLEGD